ncbi:MAG: hypothetical protein ACKVZH_24685, partial [Blastocatellia bacterium]
DISRIIKYAPSELIGRESEIALLNDAWAKVQSHEAKRPHILTFVAMGGEGKTSLVAKWAADLAANDWPGCDAVFAWSFYSQGTRELVAASSDLFLNEALTFFGDAEMAGSAAGAFDKGRRLAQLVGERRALLILDGLEPLQYPPGPPLDGKLKDEGLVALLKGLATQSHGLCTVTTRYSMPDLKAFWQNTAPEHALLRLSQAAGVALLEKLGVRKESGTRQEFEQLVADVKGHALTLNLLGTYLRDAHAGDIRRRDLIALAEADAEEQGGHAFRVIEAYVRSLENGGKTDEDKAKGRRALASLQLLGLFDRPATADCLRALWQAPAIAGLTEPLVGLSEAQRNLSLKRLEDAKLLTVNRDAAGTLVALDAHPLIREYFSGRMKEEGGMMKEGEDSSFILPNSAFREAHRRLYEHLCATTKEGNQPTLEDLQPLYEAVAHGCQAGLQQEALYKVYRDRILRGTGSDGFYSWRKLGAFGSDLGAIVCFFEQPWGQLSASLKEVEQAWLLNEAAFRLRALGRLNESLEPMRAGLPIELKSEDWKNAAIRATNLSELELTLGEVARAVGDAEQSVNYADCSGDAFQRYSKRTTHADALHQAGRRTEAESLFQEAEQMQADDQPEYPLLYSLRGFRYCDLLLAESERAALECGGKRQRDAALDSSAEELESKALPPLRYASALQSCRAVTERAAKMFEWRVPGDSLLTIALDHLTLGRAALYQAILEQSAIRNPQSAIDRSAIESAVNGLRRAGQQDDLPRGLLTRAWLRALTGAFTGQDSAQEDLDEAWEIAERGSMKLHLADIHLYRARLFFRESSYPWQSPQHDLAEAERLINECGYHRRDEELADAKRAILGEVAGKDALQRMVKVTEEMNLYDE